VRGWLTPIAIGLVVAFLAVVGLLVLRPGATPSSAERVDRLAAELRCPDCQGLSVADSPTAAAREIRRQIDELVAAGASDAEVRSHFVDRYGAWILLAPRAGIAWVVPWLVAAAAVVALVVLLLRRASTARDAVPDGPPGLAGDRRSVREEAEALDA
jgi:cytochrome c-type biogenesis protein CcmH/NrfF